MGAFGFFALVLAFLTSVVTVFLFLFNSSDKKQQWTAGKIGVYATFGLVTITVIILEIALLTHNFSIVYVANYSSYDMPLQYLISGLWAGNAGSLLFWAWVLSICGMVVMARWKEQAKEYIPFTGAITMSVLAFFLLLLVLKENPFVVQEPVPADGRGLNPLLQNPAMIIHPPFLLAGYVTLTIPFAIGIAALLTRKLGEDWLIKARGWALLSWLFLGAGNLIGAWWAYVELGWGGYWAWDPVENAGLMPWLVLTAFLHSMNIQRKRKSFKIWTLAMLIFSFFLTIFGTFLTRSDFSVAHGFGVTGLEPFFLTILVIILFGSYWLLISRRKYLKSETEIENAVSREGTFLLTNLLLLISTLSILFATLYPIFLPEANGQKATVDSAFFNMFNTPIFMIIIALTGICIIIGWRKASWKELGKDLLIPGVIFFLTMIIPLAAGVTAIASLAYALAAFSLSATVIQFIREIVKRRKIKTEVGQKRRSTLAFMAVNKDRYGAYIVHISLAMMAIGIIGSSFFDIQKDAVLSPGDSMTIKDYTLTYDDMSFSGSHSKMTIAATLNVFKNGKFMGALTTEKKLDANFDGQVTEVAIRATLTEDLYVILIGWQTDKLASFRVLINPLVNWIWIGGALLVIGGLLCFLPQKEPSLITNTPDVVYSDSNNVDSQDQH